MKLGGWLRGLFLCVFWGELAAGQTAPTSVRIETIPLHLTMPDAYQVTVVLQPVRRLLLVAPADGVIRRLDARLGAMVRESQELAQLDPDQATAQLKIALAEVKEKEALVKSNVTADNVTRVAIYQAQLDAAQARSELAKLELDRRTVRAPFAGRVLDVPVCVGQYVLKGATIAELADITSLRAVLPVDRRRASTGATLTVPVEEQDVTCKVQAMLPLPESYAQLRELATPFAAAAVVFPNPKGELEPGLRARPAGVPTAAIATVPRRAVRPDDVRGSAAAMVQVIRNEYVTNVPVQILGGVGPERAQVSGLLREADALIIGSSVPLLPGTLVRFAEGAAARAIEGTSPDPSHGGAEAGITPPGASRSSTSSTGSSTAPGRSPRRTGATLRPSNPPAQSHSGSATPF
jgi:RND family efflux transporter MFP subunit